MSAGWWIGMGLIAAVLVAVLYFLDRMETVRRNREEWARLQRERRAPDATRRNH